MTADVEENQQATTIPICRLIKNKIADTVTERYIPQHDQRTNTEGLIHPVIAGKKSCKL